MAYTTIDDPSAYFQTALYTGNNSNRSITNDGNSDLQPDWIWGKSRSDADSPTATDSSRGNTKVLTPSSDEAEGTASDYVTAFNSDGFSLGTNNGMNKNTLTYVAWQWKCNGGTATATVSESGNNPANVRQTNTDAGFSIITYTGTGAVGTIAHGLGVVPEFIIVKNRGRVKDWCVYHASIEETHKLELNLTSAKSDDNAVWNDTAPTSSVFTVGPSDERTNANDDTYVAYCFAPIQGYSKFGSYTGNGSENGPFVYTGFKPRWIMFKNAGAAEEWVLQDTTRNPNNPVTKNIRVDSNIAEADASNLDIDFLSNGFKNRSNQAQLNSDGVSYVYMAFAEHPFVSSEGVPTTAR